MKILGIESSSTTASIAVVEEGKLLGEYTINHTLKHSKTLMPMIQEMLKRLELKPSDLGLIAISEGPGSFTGLRIGSATAKGLAQGLNIPIVSIPTMQVLASTVQIPEARVHGIMYARASEVYYQTFSIAMQAGRFLVKPQTQLETCEIEAVIEKLKTESKPVYLVGDAVDKFDRVFEELGEEVIRFLPVYTNLMAKNVAILGQSRYDDGDVMTYQEHRPYYHKKSQAEREYENKNHEKIEFATMAQEDIQAIVDIENSTFSIPWTFDSFVQELSNPRAHYIVLKSNNRLIGYGGFWKILDEGHITNVAIALEHRGLGYGTMLIEELLREAKKMDIHRLTLEVRPSNLPAIKAYEKFGFTIEGKRCRYYTNPIEDAMIMWLSL